MAKIKFTKSELKKQKEALERFDRYLPILQLKKQQLLFEINKVHRAIERLSSKMEEIRKKVIPWVDVFAEETVKLKELLKVSQIKTATGNIAGVDIAVFKEVVFEEKEYDFMRTPLWVDNAIEVCREVITLRAQVEVYHAQLRVLKEEERITAQRVNLFEKIKIPEAKENIRVIRIFLGDLQTAGVVRGKIAKTKIERMKA